ncbi:hypothetical protein MTR67_015658 [Solanum verrucosum]|uniref:Uncharacterized protein n=1 Tax=Solanum verrucosum TaxID=315347 RepID=A0AAF0QFM9_SOLVR|nr:hypothetical protein MTR67_015658 [Solanum verrucosum]
MAESREDLSLPERGSKKQICLPNIVGERSSMPLPECQKPHLDVTIVKSSYNKPSKSSNLGPLLLALSKMKQARCEGQPVTDTIVMHDGEEVDLGPIMLKIERRETMRLEAELEKTEKT